MTRTILITGPCQLGSLASAVQRIFPNDAVIAHSSIEFSGLGTQGIDEIAAADFWIMMGDHAYEMSALERVASKDTRIIRCAIVTFSAFHPDNVYLFNSKTGAFPQPHYSSRICAWAYSRNIDADDAEKLFKHEVFYDLGFFNYWNDELVRLKKRFDDCDLDFRTFFSNVQRQGVFMNCINHPKPQVLVQLAKTVALKMGASHEVLKRPIEIVDSLAGQLWPVYPEIADYYGVPGSYDWILDDVLPEGLVPGGLRGFLEKYYGLYQHHDTSFEGISFMQNGKVDALDSKYDEVLFGHLKGRA